MAFSWKAARNIMRSDNGVSTEYQRLEQFVTLTFLRIFSTLEEEWAEEAEDDDKEFFYSLPDEYKWKNWAEVPDNGKALTGEALVDHLNNLYDYCKKEMNVDGLENRQRIIKKVFENGPIQHMRNGVLLRDLVNLVNELHYEDAKQRFLFGQMYEEMLKLMQASSETGEYYTPRAVTNFIVDMLDPKIGEKFGDFACGTGGFLTAAIDHLKKDTSTSDKVKDFEHSIVGCELKPIPYLLCATNLMVHGINEPELRCGTAFDKDILDYDDKDRVDVIGMNPPYGGMTTESEKNRFAEGERTSETAVLFVRYIIERLKDNGRAGVIIPDGFLFGTGGAFEVVKKMLLEKTNLHTIIRLPSSVFAPYTSITTNILFFDKKAAKGAEVGYKTKDVWVYRMDMPEGYKHFSKTKPIEEKHMQIIKDWWANREEIADPTDDPTKITYKSKSFSAKEIAEDGYNLDLCKYPKEEEVILSPKELLDNYHQERAELDARIDSTLGAISKLLNF